MDVHARDTAKRLDVLPSERHVRVLLDGELLAESGRPRAVRDTAAGAVSTCRWRRAARRAGAPPTVKMCPHKGIARWFSVRAVERVHPDLTWSYPEPVPECPRIAGLVCFFNEHVDLVIDGVPQERPRTPWSRGGPEISPS